MCKYCNFKDGEISDEELVFTSIGMGENSNLLGLEIFIFDDEENNPVMNVELYPVCGGDEPIISESIKINYCPICGRKL